jgi:RNA polymerase sigma factor (sigma-70 family)
VHDQDAENLVILFVQEHPGLLEQMAGHFLLLAPAQQILEAQDLVQEGLYGLWQAAQRYDATRGHFAPYGRRRAAGAMVDALRALFHNRGRLWKQPRFILEAEKILRQIPQEELGYAMIEAQMDIERSVWPALSHQEATVLQWKYLEESPLRLLGLVWGVTEGRVSQIHTQALWHALEAIRDKSREEETIMETLGDAFPVEQARLRGILASYKELGAPTIFSIWIKELLKLADKAAIEQDTRAMLRIYQKMIQIEA